MVYKPDKSYKPLKSMVRNIGGLKYHYDNGFPTKRQAQDYATGMRKHGYLVRIIYNPVDEWYNVFMTNSKARK